MITDRDIDVLRQVARYYVVSRLHVQRLCFPDDRTGRATRRRLQALVTAKLIQRCRAPIFNAGGGSPWPAYYPSRLGAEVLAQHLDDERFLATPTRCPEPLHLHHWLAVTDTHIALDQAIARQNLVRLEGWLNEWDVVNPEATQPERRYRLYPLLRESPRLVCAPDSAFLLAVGQHRKVFYLEQDRSTSGVRQIAARKTPGYAEMAKRKAHTRHFPDATIPTFTVLMVVPTSGRRDAIRKALRGKPGAEHWKFAVASDLTPERFLHASVFYPCEGAPTPLVKPQTIVPDHPPVEIVQDT